MDREKKIIKRANQSEESVFSVRLKAGKRRTYFFDVKTTLANDYFLTITESKKRFEGEGYERHSLHLYKEDFNKFVQSMQEVIDHIKNELMPDYDFDEFDRRERYYTNEGDETTPIAEETKEVATKIDEETISPEEPTPSEDQPLDEDELKWD